MKRTVLTVLAAIVGTLVAAVLVTAGMWPVLNEVETGKTREYSDVLPQYFSADPKRVYREVEAAVIHLDAWHIEISNPDAGNLFATRTSMLGTVDDVTVSVVPQTEFVTRIDIKSASRAGKGDFGQNARNVRELQAELDQRLGAVRFDPYAHAEAEAATK